VNPAAAVWLGCGISIAAQNCNSLNVVSSIKNQDLKISALCGYNADIILLSDVRLNGRERIITDKLRMSYTMYHNSSSNKRGVAVLFRNSLDYEILEQVADPQENAFCLKPGLTVKKLLLELFTDRMTIIAHNFLNF
jgi:exonuclease III